MRNACTACSVRSCSSMLITASTPMLITIVTVAIELVLGMGLAVIMHRTLVGRGLVRTSALIPYGIVTVVAAFGWRYAFDPASGFVQGLPLISDSAAPLTERGGSLIVIILTETWKTTPTRFRSPPTSG